MYNDHPPWIMKELSADDLRIKFKSEWSFRHLMMAGVIAVITSLVVSWMTNHQIVERFIAHNEKIILKVDNFERVIGLKSIERVTVTAYSPRRRETDSTPFQNAAMEKVREGDIAVSRDLFEAGWVFGKKVWVEGRGIYTIMDLMNSRYEKRVDIFMMKTFKARKFGMNKDVIIALLDI